MFESADWEELVIVVDEEPPGVFPERTELDDLLVPEELPELSPRLPLRPGSPTAPAR